MEKNHCMILSKILKFDLITLVCFIILLTVGRSPEQYQVYLGLLFAPSDLDPDHSYFNYIFLVTRISKVEDHSSLNLLVCFELVSFCAMEETFCHFLLAQLLHGTMITILDQQYKEYTNCKSINMIFLQIVPTFYMLSASC